MEFFGIPVSVSTKQGMKDDNLKALVVWLEANVYKGEGEMNHRFVNIGANDGVSHEPTLELLKLGWKGVAVEPGNPEKITRNYEEMGFLAKGQVQILHTSVNPGNVQGLLTESNTPLDVDVFKIDVSFHPQFVIS